MRCLNMILLACVAPMLALAACMGGTATAPTSPTTTAVPASAGVRMVVGKADGAIDRASAAYFRVKPTIDLLIGLLPSDWAEQVRKAQSIVDRSLRAAKLASTAAAQLVELRKAEAAMRDIEAVIGKTPAAD